MNITKPQAQMLANLAVASRPYRAPTWDEAGVMAAIAEIRHLSLPEIILRVVRAAADRDAITPGVIPKNGPHANEQLKPPKWEPDVVEAAERCSTCGKRRDECERLPRFADDDHTFAPDFKDRRPSEAAALIRAALREEMNR